MRKVAEKPFDSTTEDPSKDDLLSTLRVIEHICGAEERTREPSQTETEKELNDVVRLVYRLAHVARKPSCMTSHKEWEEERQSIIDELNA